MNSSGKGNLVCISSQTNQALLSHRARKALEIFENDPDKFDDAIYLMLNNDEVIALVDRIAEHYLDTRGPDTDTPLNNSNSS
jgi:hypothetical protein